MAIAPLRIATPTVPLIGGKELPKASGEGVRVADISNSFSQLSAELQSQDEANKRIDDNILAKTDAENYVSDWVGKNPDKNPLGAFTKLPNIDGTPTYRAAALDALESNTLTQLQVLASTDFASIRIRTDIDTDKKIALMNAKAQGYLDALPAPFKGQARTFLSREVTQWSDSLKSQDYENQQGAILNGINGGIKMYTDLAFSAGAAGTDYTPYTQKVYELLDKKVRLSHGAILQADADAQKQLIGRVVLSASTQHMIANAAFDGKLSVAELNRYAVALDSNADATLSITEPPAPGAAVIAAGEREAPGPGKTEVPTGSVKQISTKQHREMIGDETLVNQTASDLKELAGQLSRHDAEAEKRLHFGAFVLNADGVTPMPPTLKQTQDDIFSEVIERGGLQVGADGEFLHPDDVRTMVATVTKTLVMPQVFTDALKAMAQGNTREAKAALTVWNWLSEARIGQRETGRTIFESVPTPDSSLLNGYRDLMSRMVRAGASAEATEAAWRDMTIKLRDPKNSKDNLRRQYGISVAGTDVEGTSFDADVQKAFLAHYNTMGTMPAIFQREVEEAYQIERIMGDTALTNAQVLAKVLDYQFNRFAASKAFKGGFAFANTSNPPGYKATIIDGYRVPEMLAPPKDPDLWLNDFTMEQIQHRWWWNQIVTDPELKHDLDQIIAAGDIQIGKTVFLNPTNTGLEQTQFEVWVMGNDGVQHQLFVRDDKGRAQPMLIDPGIVRSTIDARKLAAQEADRVMAEGSAKAKNMIYDEWNLSTPEDFWSGSTGLPDPDVDRAVFEEWLASRPQEFRDRYKQNEKDYMQQLKKRLGIMDELDRQTFPGQSVSPEIQMQPRAEGVNVTLGAIQTLERVLPDGIGGQAMMNLALVETDGGVNVKYDTLGDSGIWQVNTGPNGSFLEVQRRARIPGNAVYEGARKVKQALGIDVLTATTRDLEKPLINAVFARLTMLTDQSPVTEDVEGQLRFYTTVYNPNATATMQKNFRTKANSILVSEAYAAAPSDTGRLEPGGPGLVTDMGGNAFPASFNAINASAQLSAQRLSAAFGKPLRITEHGGVRYGGKTTSQHYFTHKTAIDIYVDDYNDEEKTQLIALAISMGYRGIGGYAAGDGKGTIHLDLRPGIGNQENGLAIWWRNQPGVDGPWRNGAKWFKDGINRGYAMYGRNSA